MQKPLPLFILACWLFILGEALLVSFSIFLTENSGSSLVALIEGTENDRNLTLKTLEELCRMYPKAGFQIRSDGAGFAFCNAG